MLIGDLSYLEGISESHPILGSGAAAFVLADANALGDSTYTLTDTTVTSKVLGNGGSMAKGRGIAVSIGDVPTAGVIVDGSGDKVIEKTKVHYFKNKDMVVARGFVIAIDH